MKRKNDNPPIFYKNKEEMDKPLDLLMHELRSDLAIIRGKLHDIKFAYGWDERIEVYEGGLTCMIAAMHGLEEEWEKFEAKSNKS